MNRIEKLENSTKFLDKALEVIAVFCLILSVVLAFVGVILRYQFGISYQILEEICRYAIVYGVFAYIGPLIKKNEHIKMSLLEDRLSRKSKHLVEFLIGIILFIAFVILFYAGIIWASSIYSMNLMTLSGEMLMVIPAFAIVAGMFFGCVYALLQMIIDFNLFRAETN
ncbi:putative TRAP transporter small permease protein [Siminovitchia terrae]|uniref:TRAP transporter small permease protein n=1 Tax=Siminovitchia terrae TaxID=1914933 RepID=A0A429X6G3_SIMTE|nr:TRAP transporter small permease subunit [Siminovitchia terrae]RST59017.1 TRAP transporter small permease subunit [Siminovitchia terrae]GIN92353.1 putative TRAP transporter small permease protein [Siminovitchia terrae]GIN96611.1 putative TRAP transporter small permease protein [Siminovitchia terrae]